MRIGYIYANIAGDSRYGSKIEVTREGTSSVKVALWESSPVGGMDSGLGSDGFRETAASVVRTADRKLLPKLVLKEIRYRIDREVGTTIKTYGKPTKRFSWYGTSEKGLNLKLVREALELTMEDA
jgi:hypothetical protein